MWVIGMQGGIPPCIPGNQPHRITSTKCRTNPVVSPDDLHILATKHVEIDKYTKNKLYTKLALFISLQDRKIFAVFQVPSFIFITF